MTRYWNLTATQRPELAFDFILGVVRSMALDRGLRMLCLFWIIAFPLALSTFSLCLWLFSLFSYQCWSQNRHLNFLELKLIHPPSIFLHVSCCISEVITNQGRSLSLTTKKLRFQVQGQTGYKVNSRSVWGNLVRLHLRMKSKERMGDITHLEPFLVWPET